MFERVHHQRIERVLHAMDASFLADAHCGFGGGTAIVLQLGEYRESVDIDFLCADTAGYRRLRETVASNSLGRIFRTPIPLARDVRTQRDKISTYLQVGDTPIRIEFVLEGRIPIAIDPHPELPVPVLTRDDLYAEKLLANADRALDRSQRSRDLIDLAHMILGWGPVPRAAIDKAESAYGQAILRYYDLGTEMLRDTDYRNASLAALGMPPAAGDMLLAALVQHRPLRQRGLGDT